MHHSIYVSIYFPQTVASYLLNVISSVPAFVILLQNKSSKVSINIFETLLLLLLLLFRLHFLPPFLEANRPFPSMLIYFIFHSSSSSNSDLFVLLSLFSANYVSANSADSRRNTSLKKSSSSSGILLLLSTLAILIFFFYLSFFNLVFFLFILFFPVYFTFLRHRFISLLSSLLTLRIYQQ